MITDLVETLKPISKFFHIITHPSIMWNWLIDVSYWAAVLICVISLIYYAGTKSRKAIQILNFTIITYILLKAISGVL